MIKVSRCDDFFGILSENGELNVCLNCGHIENINIIEICSDVNMRTEKVKLCDDCLEKLKNIISEKEHF